MSDTTQAELDVAIAALAAADRSLADAGYQFNEARDALAETGDDAVAHALLGIGAMMSAFAAAGRTVLVAVIEEMTRDLGPQTPADQDVDA